MGQGCWNMSEAVTVSRGGADLQLAQQAGIVAACRSKALLAPVDTSRLQL